MHFNLILELQNRWDHFYLTVYRMS